MNEIIFPHYRYKSKEISKNINLIKNAFLQKDINLLLSYSFKTNSEECVLKEIKQQNLTAEVVSPYELEKARTQGFTGTIIYNGVCKTKETIFQCLENNEIVNIDNEEDFNLVMEYAGEKNTVPQAGIRINFDIGNGIKSRFGIKTDSQLYKKIIEASQKGKIKIICLSCHFTKASEPQYFQKRAEYLVNEAKNFPQVKYIDLGGNMYSPQKNNLFPEYASLIKQIFTSADINPTLILECGTPVVSSAFDLVSHVLHIKENFAILDVSFLDFLLPAMSDECKFKIQHNENNPKLLENITLTGCTCLENDILKKSFNGKLETGDTVIFQNIGEYSLTLSNNFIMSQLPVIEY